LPSRPSLTGHKHPENLLRQRLRQALAPNNGWGMISTPKNSSKPCLWPGEPMPLEV